MAATAEWEPPVAPEAAPVAQPERKGTAPAPGPPAAINRKAENNQPDEIHYVNPFVHKLVWDDPIDKAKTALLTVILLPFRVVLILVCLVVAWALANIGLYGLSKEDLRTKPLVGWRRRLKGPLGEFATLAYTCAGLGITIRGRQASRAEAPVLVVSPHSSFLDAVIIYVTGLSSPLVRNADRNLGKLIDYAQPIYVCREDPHSRQTTIREIIQRANSKEDWPQILIFPEGTCTNRTSLIKFKPGAFYPGVPIQPVLMRYPNKVDTVTWTWEGPNAIQLLWRTLTQFHTFCEIEFLPVYYPSEAEKANPKLYADNVRMLMAKALDIPISDYTFDDCKLMTFVKNVGMPHPAAIADIGKLRETLKIAATDRESKIVASERQFTDANSLLTYPQFAERMELDVQQEAAHNLFHKLIRPETPDVIDFREYLLLALFLITLYKPKLIFVESLFHLYGVNGRVNRTQLYQTLQNLVRISQKELNSIFLQADPDNLGTIDYSQFVKAIERNPLLAKLQKNNDPNNLRLG
ncbi:lysophosphatidylcholine acyltransferase isoform X2 [Anopheles gambiae]|uniref:lysophosphatidylcholine acyltransferase isoform X2 n=1 Tax=Anopheles gambiae TaxID=7165 RepID=UPI002AC9BB15|nr:lysophosphatidylcholine acyltransferase isoform X2 [Anopheles gambiae]XP_061519593.1 lysophosphatidylcholine acyltransferase isoform X2 [Anopheles gambiae]